jgi:UDP-N-acetylmuramate--alanine ligase
MFKKIRHLHFVGIGGIGMSGIAEVLLNLGYRVSGSDLKASAISDRLASLGARVHYTHRPENVVGADVVVISSAVRKDNPEVAAAIANGIPVIRRAEMLAELARLKYTVAVAGSHGKTTTTSMLAVVLARGGLDPTAIIGGRLKNFGSNAKIGLGEYMVAEADESDGSFLHLSPTIAVVTNIDPEHLDHYGDLEGLKQAFTDFANKVPFYGAAVVCLDDANIQSLLPRVNKRLVTYGFTRGADYHAKNILHDGLETHFDAYYREERLGGVSIHMVGEHNVLNALAAIAAGRELDLPFSVIRDALGELTGIERRFELKLNSPQLSVVDDYGHHPAEIKATLKAARQAFDRRLITVFQPHRYSRTRDLFDQFTTAFYDTDVLLMLDIYAAGEQPIENIDAERLVGGIREHGHRDVRYVKTREKAHEVIKDLLAAGDVVLTLGAGDVWRLADDVTATHSEGKTV